MLKELKCCCEDKKLLDLIAIFVAERSVSDTFGGLLLSCSTLIALSIPLTACSKTTDASIILTHHFRKSQVSEVIDLEPFANSDWESLDVQVEVV